MRRSARILTLFFLIAALSLPSVHAVPDALQQRAPGRSSSNKRSLYRHAAIAARALGDDLDPGRGPSSAAAASSDSPASSSHLASSHIAASSSAAPASKHTSSNPPSSSATPSSTSSSSTTQSTSSSSPTSSSAAPSTSSRATSSTASSSSAVSSKASSSSASSSAALSTTAPVVGVPLAASTPTGTTNLFKATTPTISVISASSTGSSKDLSAKGFFQNTGAVAGTFSAVGLVALAGLGFVLAYFLKKRRSSQEDVFFEKYTQERGGNTAAAHTQSADGHMYEEPEPEHHEQLAPTGAYPDRAIHYGQAYGGADGVQYNPMEYGIEYPPNMPFAPQDPFSSDSRPATLTQYGGIGASYARQQQQVSPQAEYEYGNDTSTHNHHPFADPINTSRGVSGAPPVRAAGDTASVDSFYGVDSPGGSR